MTKRFSNTVDGTNGAFMGFDTSESDDSNTSDVEQGSHLLDNVSMMLEGDKWDVFKSLSSCELN